MKRTAVLLISLSLALSACITTVTGPITKQKYSSGEDLRYIQETIEYDRQQYLKQHPRLSPYIRRVIAQGRIVKGMTRDEVRASWGEPYIVYRTKTNEFVNEQWLYRNFDLNTLNRVNFFLNFRADKLATWQEQ